MPAFIDSAPDEIARARTLYEDTGVSPRDVARILGISLRTFHRRVDGWGWRRRKVRLAELDARALGAGASREEAARVVGERLLAEKLSALERAKATAVAQLDALRATQERVAHAAAASVDGERSARALNHLTRALVAIEKSEREGAQARREEAADLLARRNAAAPALDELEDLDAMRDRLARRLTAIREEHEEKDLVSAAVLMERSMRGGVSGA